MLKGIEEAKAKGLKHEQLEVCGLRHLACLSTDSCFRVRGSFTRVWRRLHRRRS